MTETAALSPVLTFPLPSDAGGGKATVGVKRSARDEHVTFVFTCDALCATVTIPAIEAAAFALHVCEAAKASFP